MLSLTNRAQMIFLQAAQYIAYNGQLAVEFIKSHLFVRQQDLDRCVPPYFEVVWWCWSLALLRDIRVALSGWPRDPLPMQSFMGINVPRWLERPLQRDSFWPKAGVCPLAGFLITGNTKSLSEDGWGNGRKRLPLEKSSEARLRGRKYDTEHAIQWEAVPVKGFHPLWVGELGVEQVVRACLSQSVWTVQVPRL